MPEESIKKQTLSGVKWTALEQFSTQAITFVLSIILARLLLPSDYGTIGMLAVFMAVSGTFIDSGFGQALIRKPDIKEEDYSTVFYVNLSVSVLCYAAAFLCSSLIASFFNMPILSLIVKVYCFTLVINAFGSVQRTRLTKNLNFKALAKINVISTIFSGVVGIALAYAGWGVWALVWQAILSGIFSNIILWIIAKWVPQRVFSKKSFKDLFGFGSKVLAGGIIWQIYANLTPIIIGKFFSANDLGFYSRGSNIAQLPANTIFGVLSKVTYPIFAKLQNDEERLVYVYRKYIKSTSMAIMFSLLLLTALAKPIVLILLTDKWADCIIYLQLFAISIITDHVDKLNLNLLNVVGRSDLTLKLEVYKRVISLTILFASIPFGIIGICVSKIIYAQIALMFNTYYAGKLFGIGYWIQIKDFFPYIAIGVICVAPAYLMTYTSMPNWIVVGVGTVVAVALYMGILKLSKDASYEEFVAPIVDKYLCGK